MLLYPLVTPEGFEPSIAWMKARSPRPLDDGAKVTIFYQFINSFSISLVN
jgi:hypothetical protein